MKEKLSGRMRKWNAWIEGIDRRWEFFLILAFAALLVLGVVVGMGTLSSGFHLVDDHEFLKWEYEMKCEHIPVLELIKQKVSADLVWRYTPLYYAARIFSCYIFGTNLTAYFVMKALEIICTIVLLYYCGKQMGADRKYSLLFALISMVGYQSAVWWKLGPQEAQCTLLFAAGFFCMLKWLKKGGSGWMAASLFAFAVMVNYKENYILLIPFLMVYVIYHELTTGQDAISWKTIGTALKKRFWYLFALGILFLLPVAFIIFYVGVNDYGNVGLDAGASIGEYVEAIAGSFQGDLKWFKRFGILFILILLTYWDELKKLWKEILLAAVFLLPQFVIFGRSGIGERYILPSSIGFAFFFIVVIPKWKVLSGKRRTVYVLGILLLLAAHGRAALREADYFRYRGESVTTMLESTREMVKEDGNILACFRPNEEGNLTINYWMKLHGFDNVYYWTEEKKTVTRECDINIHYDEEYYTEQNLEDMDIIVMYNHEDRHWVYDMSIDTSGYIELPCGTLTIYVKEDAVNAVIEPQVEGLRINF